jgi:nitrogen regulatory protein PII
MQFLVMLVLHKTEECTSIMDAWDALGVGGITILESSGLGRARKSEAKHFPIMPSLSDFLRTPEHRHRTIFTVVEDESWVDRILEATEGILGDMESPNNGVIFVLPVVRAHGLTGGRSRANK